jgi:DNA replication protein DnaC
MDINIISRQKEHRLAPLTFDEGKKVLWACATNLMPAVKYDDKEAQIVSDLLKYFMNITDGPYDINKGLYIYGYYGSGKTKLMQMFFDFCRGIQFNQFKTTNFKTLMGRIRTDGFESLKFLNTTDDIFIDDLGFLNQGEINHYGNKINTLVDLVYGRYVKFENYHTRTYYTSNLVVEGNKASIRDLYGDGIAGRIKDSCNIILYDFKHHR